MIARLLRSVADAIDPPAPPPERRPTVVDVTGPSMFEVDEGRQEARQYVAVSLLDDEVIGYVVMRVLRTTQGRAHVDLEVAADDPFWPALSETAARLVLEGDRVFGKK